MYLAPTPQLSGRRVTKAIREMLGLHRGTSGPHSLLNEGLGNIVMSATVGADGRDTFDDSFAEPAPATFIAQSFGSCVLGALLKDEPDLVGAALLLDPVAVVLHQPNVCDSFLYKTPRSVMMIMLHYFCSSELRISMFMQR